MKSTKILLLPNRIKWIGLSTAAISILAIVLAFFFAEQIGIDKEVVFSIGKIFFLMSLLFLVFSEEKEESELLKKLRLKHLTSAILFSGLILIIDSLWALFSITDGKNTKSGMEILIIILLYYLILFNYHKPKTD
ncbi:MAG: hypothetical protein WBV11_03590 [Salegentibacter sp.]